MNDNRLEELKEEKNIKSKEVAKYLNINESTYSEWEHNKVPIPTRRLIQLAEFYHVNIDYILKLTKNKANINYNADIDLQLIGMRLKEIRTSLKMTLRELGAKLNTSFSALSKYERGETLIQSDTLIALCKISNYSIDWVLGRSKNKYYN